MYCRKRDDAGAAALEFALVLPLLLLILFGVINFGVVFAQQLALDNAARQAARYAAVEGHDCPAIEEHARDAATTIAMSRSEPEFAITGGCPAPCADSVTGQDVTVTMTLDKGFLIPMPVPGLGDGIEIEGEGTFRCEFS